MAREIVIWCDPCLIDDAREPGEETEMTLGTDKPRRLAMCEVHRKEYLAPLQVLLAEHGQPVEAVKVPRKSPGRPAGGGASATDFKPAICLEEGCRTINSNLKALRNHARSTHGLDAPEHDAKYGSPTSVEFRALVDAKMLQIQPELDLIPDEFKCPLPDCDAVYDPEHYSRPAQAIGQHKRAAHPDVDFSQVA